jgi:hypothetical protein
MLPFPRFRAAQQLWTLLRFSWTSSTAHHTTPHHPTPPRSPGRPESCLPGPLPPPPATKSDARPGVAPARAASLPHGARAQAQGPRDLRSSGPTARCCASRPGRGFGPGPLTHPTVARLKSWCFLQTAAPPSPGTRQRKRRRHGRQPPRPTLRPETLHYRRADMTKWPQRGRLPSMPCATRGHAQARAARPRHSGDEVGPDSAPAPGDASSTSACLIRPAPGVPGLFHRSRFLRLEAWTPARKEEKTVSPFVHVVPTVPPSIGGNKSAV